MVLFLLGRHIAKIGVGLERRRADGRQSRSVELVNDSQIGMRRALWMNQFYIYRRTWYGFSYLVLGLSRSRPIA